MPNLDELLREYARLLIREGLTVQPGQRLVRSCPAERADLARLCAECAYDAGCAEAIMRWNDDALTRLKYLRAAEEVFDRANPWEVLLADTVSAEGAAWLSVSAEDPENLKGVAPDRIRRARISAGKAMEKFRVRETRNEFPWCVCAAPSEGWARKVFPALDAPEAVARLWEEIFKACRVAEGRDAIAAWRAHSAELHRRVEKLNAYDFKTLHYKNALGTDLTVELPEGHYWAGGAEKCVKSGLPFSANIPTEEVFTLPKRDGVNGVVCASKPLVYNGTVIEGLRFELNGGRIAGVRAERGLDVLKDAVGVDEGASFLGEVALVPYDSPISRSGVLFYNTLFDENASCHFAFGDAYPCIKGSESMSQEELKARGANSSLTHVDFMVGTSDLSITGTTRGGETAEVFRDGNFTF